VAGRRGFRIGELCGLHLADLHLREGAGCGQCRAPHVHVCHRDGNPNRAAAKTKHPWRVENGVVTGGLIKRASPAMIHAYFEYVTTGLSQLGKPGPGQPAWAALMARMRRKTLIVCAPCHDWIHANPVTHAA